MSRRLAFIGCEILHREACSLAARSPNVVDVRFLPKGLHDLETADMRARLQQAVDEIDAARGFEAVLLGYARCNDGLVGLTARDLPVVVPRAHDCITLFMGSRAAYREYFDRCPGTYFVTTGWAERDDFRRDDYGRTPESREGVMGHLGLTESYESLVETYGEDNARFITESLGNWRENYTKYLYIEMGTCDESALIDRTRRDAEDRGWDFELRPGDWTLLRKLFEGPWDADFVVCQPGERLVACNDERVLGREGPGPRT
jgi:hypothetical protein